MSAASAVVIPIQGGDIDVGPTHIHDGLTMNEAALAVIRAQYGAALANEAGARTGDVESLHDMRVAVRRMRAAMAAFAGVLPARARTLRRSLGWLATPLGDVRDHDVHLEQIATWTTAATASEQRGLAAVEHSLLERRSAARARMIRVLDSQRRARAFASIEDMLRNGPMPRAAIARVPAVDAAPDVVARRYRKVRSLGDSVTPYTPAETLHALRIRTKRLRYVVEFFVPLYGKPARSFAKRAVRIQDLLGRHQDAIVSGAMLTELVESSGPNAATAFAIGRLAERHNRDAADARTSLPDAYSAIAGKRWRALQRAMDSKRTARLPETTG